MKRKLVAGLMGTMFLVAMVFSAIPVQGQPPAIVIGIVGPFGSMQFTGLWDGAMLAVAHIGGSITIGGITHTVTLVPIDEASVPTPNPTRGIMNLLGALFAQPDMRYLIGGFRAECVAPMEEMCMMFASVFDRPIWILSGASEDLLIDVVQTDYDWYKYMFRNFPMSSSQLVSQLLMALRGNMLPQIVESTMGLLGTWPIEWLPFAAAFGYPPESFTGPGRLARMYGDPNAKNVSEITGNPLWSILPNASGYLGGVNTYILADNLAWCEDMVRILVGNGVYPFLSDGSSNPYESPPSPAAVLGPYATVVGYERPSWFETDFTQEIANVEAADAHLIIPLFSDVAGASFTQFYGALKPDAVSFGINVEAQMPGYYIMSGGLCEYKMVLAFTGTRTQLNPYPNVVTGNTTQDVWDDYVAAYARAPIYTMWGAYDAIIALAEPSGLPSLSSFPASSDPLIALLEGTNRAGILGQFKYSDGPTSGDGKGHDVYVHPYANTPFNPPAGPGKPGWMRAVIVQWRSPGRMEVVWPRAYGSSGPKLPYAVGTKLPYWMYSLAETDLSVEGTVDSTDLVIVAQFWQQPPAWYLLEADMDDNGSICCELDIPRVGNDFGSSVTFPL